jgi:hypothetical protein
LSSNRKNNFKRFIYFSFYDTCLALFFNNSLINDTSKLRQYDAKIFENIWALFFDDDIEYVENLSPHLFYSSSLTILKFKNLCDSFVRLNRLSFSDDDYDMKNSSIRSLLIDAYNYNLDNKLLNEHLFEYLINFEVDGHLANIHRSAFRILKTIQTMKFFMNNIREFHRKHLRTLYVLNENVRFDYDDNNNKSMIERISSSSSSSFRGKQILIYLYQNIYYLKLNEEKKISSSSIILNFFYLYPDEDICLFKDFPFQRLLVPLINTNKSNCNCLQLWLTRYSNYYLENSFCLNDSTLLCNYTQMLSKCDVYKFKSRLEIMNKVDYDLLYSALQRDKNRYKWQLTDAIVYTLLVPIVGLVGVVLNFLNVLVLTNKKCAQNLQKRVYKFMLLNSTLGCVICSLSICQFSTRCSASSGRFCVDTERNAFARHFFLIVFNYLTSALKMASNCAHLFTSLDRYMLCIKGTQDEKSSTLAKHYKMLKFKPTIKAIALICLVLNVVKLFEYKTKSDYFTDLKTFPLINVDFFHNLALN